MCLRGVWEMAWRGRRENALAPTVITHTLTSLLFLSLQILTLITIITGFVYPTVWVLGEEGLQAFDINVETGVTVMSDLVGKVCPLSTHAHTNAIPLASLLRPAPCLPLPSSLAFPPPLHLHLSPPPVYPPSVPPPCQLSSPLPPPFLY